jgi:hypothetical protein
MALFFLIMEGEMSVKTYLNISNELRAFFSTKGIFKVLLPIDMVLLFSGLAVMLLSDVFGVYFGGLYYLAKWAFFLGLLLTYANLKEMFLYAGLLGYGVINLLELILGFFRSGHYFYWNCLFNAAIFGGLGYLVLKRTLTGSADTNMKG